MIGACTTEVQLNMFARAGTPHYMPPEIWYNRPYGTPADVWAVGCLLYELMTYKCAALQDIAKPCMDRHST